MDWDKAYDNSASVDNFPSFLEKWKSEAAQFRDSFQADNRARFDLEYGPGSRNRADLFMPEEKPKGLFIFIHGGYWRALDKSYWSHLAKGAIGNGFACAIPSYTLTPENSIFGITQEVAQAINVLAREVEGSIHLAGHSAGGHLVARMACEDAGLDEEIVGRIGNFVAISGLFDLAPLTKTKMNDDFQLTPEEIKQESPVHCTPRKGVAITCWIGEDELPEFHRQNTLLESWQEKGAKVETRLGSGHHHFNVIDPLQDPNSTLMQTILS